MRGNMKPLDLSTRKLPKYGKRKSDGLQITAVDNAEVKELTTVKSRTYGKTPKRQKIVDNATQKLPEDGKRKQTRRQKPADNVKVEELTKVRQTRRGKNMQPLDLSTHKLPKDGKRKSAGHQIQKPAVVNAEVKELTTVKSNTRRQNLKMTDDNVTHKLPEEGKRQSTKRQKPADNAKEEELTTVKQTRRGKNMKPDLSTHKLPEDRKKNSAGHQKPAVVNADEVKELATVKLNTRGKNLKRLQTVDNATHKLPEEGKRKSTRRRKPVGNAEEEELTKVKQTRRGKTLKPDLSIHKLPEDGERKSAGQEKPAVVNAEVKELTKVKQTRRGKTLKPDLSIHKLPEDGERKSAGQEKPAVVNAEVKELTKVKQTRRGKTLKPDLSTHKLPEDGERKSAGQEKPAVVNAEVKELTKVKQTRRGKSMKPLNPSTHKLPEDGERKSAGQEKPAVVNAEVKELTKVKQTRRGKSMKPLDPSTHKLPKGGKRKRAGRQEPVDNAEGELAKVKQNRRRRGKNSPISKPSTSKTALLSGTNDKMANESQNSKKIVSAVVGELVDDLAKAGLDPSEVIPDYNEANFQGFVLGDSEFAEPPVAVAGSIKAKKVSHRGVPKVKKPSKKVIKEKYLDMDEEDEDDDYEMTDLALAGIPYNDDNVEIESYANLQQRLLFQTYMPNYAENFSQYFNRNLAYRQDGTPNFDLEILTVVASVNLSTVLNLRDISQRTRNVEYNPKRFAPLIMRVREPKSTALMFATGKMIVSGTKTKEECRIAVRKYARILQKLGYNVDHTNYEVQNISASGNLRFPVKVHEMAKDPRIKKFVSYEAEIFPGLVYTLVCPKVKAIIFVTGAVLMTGAKTEEEVRTAMNVIYPLTRLYHR